MFKLINLPNVAKAKIPSDIELALPKNLELKSENWHFLIEIPWNDKYLQHVPVEYLNFFQFVLPHLNVRTTDVHTAICLGFIPKFKMEFVNQPIDWHVVTLALILHDCGWSQLTQADIAQSLGVTGLTLTPGAKGPKIAHAEEGEKLARKILDQFTFDKPLSPAQTDLILKCVLYHDQPEKVAGSNLPQEVQILVDLDHLWSFTHQNFWQDTVRKGVEPTTYIENLSKDLATYFVTNYGKKLATSMLEERAREISAII